MQFKNSDTFLITTTHIGYKASIISRYINSKDTVFIKIKMLLLTDTLNGVIIKGPPMWVRGDTTFFRADAFKTGDERKLKDLVTKMPEFEIDGNGNLLYKKKIVEKIMIDGEEIFADKIKLMLSNFPVHVLNTVQAIEHQTNDRLLKGLITEDRVFVNLGLNKEKLKAAFGDGEAGIGTSKKYFFNPVIFSLYGKMKLGYIGNWDNIGNGIGWNEQNELKSDPVQIAEKWMMESNQLQIINNFENRRYITNNEMSNRFQLNIPVSRLIKSKTEFHLVKDNQSQLSYNSTSIYDGLTYIQRSDTSHISNHPSLFSLTHSITWKIDTTQELDASISFYHNSSRGIKSTSYYQQGTISSVKNQIANNYNSLALTLNYTRRKSVISAEKWYAFFSQNYDSQTANGYSASWPEIFQLPDTAYQMLNQELSNRLTIAKAGIVLLKRTKTGLFITGVEINSLSSSIVSRVYFNDTKNLLTPQYPEGYNNRGHINVTSLIGNAQKKLKVLRLPVLFKAKYGFSDISKNENKVERHFTTPVYNFEIKTESRLNTNLRNSLDLSFSQQQAQPYQLYSILLPNRVNSFHRYLNISLPVRVLDCFYILSHYKSKTQKCLQISSITLGYKKFFSGFTYLSSLNSFASFAADSLIRNPSSYFYFNAGTNINSFDSKSLNYFSIGINKSQSFIQYEDKLLLSSNLFYSFNSAIKRNWGVYFLNLQNNFSNLTTILPKELKNQETENIFDIKSSVSQRVALSKQSNIILKTEWYNNNIFTSHQISFLFLDAEFNVTLPQKHLSFILRFQNITNQRYYRTWDIQPPIYQNFFTIPLVGRNAFVSVRYEL